MRIILITAFAFLLSIRINGQNQNISNGIVFDGEPFLAINPNNSQHFVVAWMSWKLYNRIVIKTRVSFDAGKNWSTANSLSHTSNAYTSADPSIDFDNNGNAFISFIDFSGYDVSPFDGGIYLSKSSDGGLTWGSPVEALNINSDPNKRPIDRPWISIDRSSGTNQGNIYITSMNAKGALAGFNPYLCISTDNGNSFQQWRYLDTLNWLSGSIIPQPMPTNCVSSNGVFYAVYPSYVPSQSLFPQFILAHSTDGGNSISYNTLFLSASNVSDTLAKKGYLIKADPSEANHLAFFYLDVTYGDMDVFMRESFDAGITWSAPIRVNDDAISNNRMQDLLWADFDHDGDIVVAWRDRRNASDSSYTTSSEIYAAFRNKDSVNFSSNFPITDNPIIYDSVLSFSCHDFLSIQLPNDTPSVVWGDARNGKLNIWFQRMTIDGTVLSTKLISSIYNPIISIYPNPFNSMITIEGDPVTEINIYNMEGKLIYSQMNKKINSNSLSINLSKLANNTYLIRCKTKYGTISKKIIKE